MDMEQVIAQVHVLTARLHDMEGQLAAAQQAAAQQQQAAESQPVAIPALSSALKPKVPDAFQGSAVDSSRVRDWLYSVALFFTASHVTDDLQRVAFAATLLRSHALTWWRGLGEARQPVTWEAFCTAIIDYFQPAQNVQFVRDRLYRLRQTKSASAFASEFRQLALDIPDISDAEMLAQFRRGLKEEVALHVAYGNPTSFEQAVTLAIAVDTVQFNSRRMPQGAPRQRSYLAATSAPGGTSQAVPMELGAVQEANLKPLSEAEREDLRKRGACFRCRQPGHLAKDCPAKGNGKRQ